MTIQTKEKLKRIHERPLNNEREYIAAKADLAELVGDCKISYTEYIRELDKLARRHP